jgi:hypothetical protein
LRLPFKDITKVDLCDERNTVSSYPFRVVTKSGESTFAAKSSAEANSWVVALRVAVAASRQRVLKRSIQLYEVTSVESRDDDVVFGRDTVALTIGAEDCEDDERVWITSITDFDKVFEVLTDAWLKQMVSE